MGFFLQVVIFSLIPVLAFSEKHELTSSDVRKTFEEMIDFHVEHDKVNHLIIKRSIKNYLNRFDEYKMYLTSSEAKIFYSLTPDRVEKGVSDYFSGELLLYRQLGSLLRFAVHRAREVRKQFQKEFILSSLEMEPSRGEHYLCFAKDEEHLKIRIRKQLEQILMREKEFNELGDWSPEDREKIFKIWEQRFQKKEKEYVAEGFEGEHYLALHTLKSLGLSLDAHSAYFSPEEALEMRAALEKQFEGIGVVLKEKISGIYVTDLIEGGPAIRSNEISAGDQIVAINGALAADMTYNDVLKAMKGKEGEEIILSLKKSKSSKVFDVVLKREKIVISNGRLQIETVNYKDGLIGVFNLPSFYESSGTASADYDMKEAIEKLKRQGALKGLIIDLRENSGGFLTQAVKISGLFMSKGVVAISKYAQDEIRYLRNLDDRIQYDGPLIILTSRASASAAEIVAQALQDYGVALIVGDEETYGKGTIQYQTVTDPFAKSFYKVTVGRYYTVSGRSTQIEGVKSDIVVPTIFSSYKIGERYLDHPLPCDQVSEAFIDPLTDVGYKNKKWFKKNYLPMLHQRNRKWMDHLPELKANSQKRLRSNKDFSLFIKAQEKLKGSPSHTFRRISNPPWGNEDLQKTEAVHIMKDMIDLSDNR